MCLFITAVVGSPYDEPLVRRIAGSHLLKWDAVHHAGVQKLLEPGEAYYLTTRGMCDCDTAIGAARRARAVSSDLEPDWERETRRLRKKGWSASKIERWRIDKQSELTRKAQEREERTSSDSDELRRWCFFVTEVLNTNAARSIGWMAHFYNGAIDQEPVPVDVRTWLKLSELTPEILLECENDVLYCVTLR